MNVTTPIDDSAAQSLARERIAGLIAGEAAVLLVDPQRRRVVAANPPAERRTRLAADAELDPAMPAWPALVAANADGAGGGHGQRLLMWTPAGPLSLSAVLSRVEINGRSLLRIVLGDRDDTAADGLAAEFGLGFERAHRRRSGDAS